MDHTLPRPIWLELGGYSGWLIELKHTQHYLDADDVVTFDVLLARLTESAVGHIVMTRYDQDSLHFYTNEWRAWLMYLRQPDDSGLYLLADGDGL